MTPFQEAPPFWVFRWGEFQHYLESAGFLACVFDRGHDEAFDDGSCILQFDAGKSVRLIAYRNKWVGDTYRHVPATLSEVWLEADEFYGILTRWRDAFESEWQIAPKIPIG